MSLITYRSSALPDGITPVRCAVCDKYVDRIEWFDDQLKRDRVIRVHCHGETDEMQLNLYRMTPEQLQAISESEGLAFTTKRIEA